MTHRTPEEFKEAAKRIKPRRWHMHDCSICGYQCGYIFEDNPELVFYDSGCKCVMYRTVRPSSWESVANHYNIQDNDEVIKDMNNFWGF